jgi:MFS family permease
MTALDETAPAGALSRPDTGSAGAPGPGAGAAGRPPWAMLAVLVTGQFMALLDVMIVNVAVPTIGTDLSASGSALQLVVSGYTIAYAMLLITGARLGSLYGFRWVYLTGLGAFTLASLACGLAPTTGFLVGARFVQGAGAAAMVPQIFSLIQREFTGAAKTRALSVYATTVAVGGVAGQVLGGVLVSADLFGTGWRPVFLVNVPVGLVLAVLVPRLVPAGAAGGGRRLDLPGLLTASAAVLLVVLPLVLGHSQGWPAWTWVSIAGGVLLAAGFVRLERAIAARGGDPLLDLRVLRSPGMPAGLAALAAGMVGFGGFLFTFTLHLQAGLGDSALRAGLTFAPAAAAFGATGYWWRRLPTRVHHALPPAGFVLTTVGYLGVAGVLWSGGTGGAWLLVTLLVVGIGFGAAFSPLLTQALVRVPVTAAADASGLLTTTMQLSQVIGIAAYGTLFLDLAAGAGPHPSATAASSVDAGIAALALLGVVGAVLLSRTVRAAARAATC